MARRCNRGIGVKLVGNGAASGAAGLDESRSVIRHARRRRRRSGAPHCIFGATAAAAYHCITNALFFPSAFFSSFSISLVPSYSNLPTSFFPILFLYLFLSALSFIRCSKNACYENFSFLPSCSLCTLLQVYCLPTCLLLTPKLRTASRLRNSHSRFAVE